MTAGEPSVAPAAVARALGVSSETVRAWIRAERIEALVTPTGRYKVPRRVLDALLAQKKTQDSQT